VPLTPHLRLHRLVSALAVVGLATACSAIGAPSRTLSFEGPPTEGGLYNAQTVASLTFRAQAEGDPEAATVDDVVVFLDGRDVTEQAEVDGSVLTYSPADLPDGDRTVTMATLDDEEGAEPEVVQEWSFVVDTTPPDVELTSPEGAVIAGEEVVVAGVTEPGATVTVAGSEVTAGADGAFEVVLDQAPDGALDIVATDAAGNSTEDTFTLVTVPSRVVAEEVRAVHVSFCGWATPSLRDPVLADIAAGRVTAVQLDIKDETGKIGPDFDIELAARIGSDQPDCRIDLPAAVEQLHDLGVPVIGRIVAFADPVLARWAWDNDERDMVIQTADGDMFTGKYAGFGNFANEDVVEYNLAVAEAAAAAGVDHILWDYIRKPDGAVENFRFVGLETSPMEAIVDFTRRADERIAPYGALHGASVYGVSADRPSEVAQDIATLSDHLDYVAPMIYPSHWGPGEYGVANPLMQPGDMVDATLEIWQEVTEGKRARVIPWLEDSNWPVRLGYPDRARYVREQIQATYDRGINEWMLWDSSVRYTTSAMIQPG
jgi:hypothetical protein